MPRVLRRLNYAHVVLAVGFVVFFGTGSRYVFGLVLIPMTEDLDVSRSTLSSALLAFTVVSALAMPVVGRLIDRHSIRTVMTVGAILSASAISLMGAVNSVWQIFALYGLFYAVGFAATHVAPVTVLMSRWFPNNTGLASSVAIIGNGTGQLVIIALLTFFLADVGWRRAHVVLGLVNAAVVVPLVLAFVRPDQPAGETRSNVRATSSGTTSMRAVLVARDFWFVIAVYMVCGFQDFFVATHIVAFAQDKGVGDFLAGNILAFMGLAGLIGVLLSGALADKYGASRPTLICFILRIGFFGYILFMQDTISIVAATLVFGFTFTMIAPLTVVFAGNIFGTARLGSISGIVSMVHQIAGGLGALVGALIFDATGSYTGAFVLMFVLSLVAATVTAMIRERPHSEAVRAATVC